MSQADRADHGLASTLARRLADDDVLQSHPVACRKIVEVEDQTHVVDMVGKQFPQPIEIFGPERIKTRKQRLFQLLELGRFVERLIILAYPLLKGLHIVVRWLGIEKEYPACDRQPRYRKKVFYHKSITSVFRCGGRRCPIPERRDALRWSGGRNGAGARILRRRYPAHDLCVI